MHNRAAKRMKLVRAPQPPPLPPAPAPERARYGARCSPARTTEPAVDSTTAGSNGFPTVNGSIVVYGRIVEVHRGTAAAVKSAVTAAATTVAAGTAAAGNTSSGNTSSGSTDARYDLKWEDGLLQYNVGLAYVRDALIVQDCSSLGSGAVLDDKVLLLHWFTIHQ
jgi:hypothetical protein